MTGGSNLASVDDEHVATAPHELKATLWYSGTLAPYWALSDTMLGSPFEGSHTFETAFPTKEGGRLERWTFDADYQQGAIEPAEHFDLDESDGMYELRFVGRGDGKQKASFPFRPWFEGMQHIEEGTPVSTPGSS